jgi:hypothetical protein
MSLAAKSTSILKRDAFIYAIKILTSVIIARKLGAEMLGVFVILSLIPSYAESFGRLKFDIAAVYFLGKKKKISHWRGRTDPQSACLGHQRANR